MNKKNHKCIIKIIIYKIKQLLTQNVKRLHHDIQLLDYNINCCFNCFLFLDVNLSDITYIGICSLLQQISNDFTLTIICCIM